MSIEWKCVGGPFGDCISHYEGTITNELTVQDFMETELSPYEWGKIQINGQMVCKFDRGKKLLDINEKLMQQYQMATIKSIESFGGWSLMDYILTVEEPEVEYTTSPLHITFKDGFNF